MGMKPFARIFRMWDFAQMNPDTFRAKTLAAMKAPHIVKLQGMCAEGDREACGMFDAG